MTIRSKLPDYLIQNRICCRIDLLKAARHRITEIPLVHQKQVIEAGQVNTFKRVEGGNQGPLAVRMRANIDLVQLTVDARIEQALVLGFESQRLNSVICEQGINKDLSPNNCHVRQV